MSALLSRLAKSEKTSNAPLPGGELQSAIAAKLAAAEKRTTGVVRRPDTDKDILDFQRDYVREYGEDAVLTKVLRKAMEDITMSYQDMWDAVYSNRIGK